MHNTYKRLEYNNASISADTDIDNNRTSRTDNDTDK